MKSPRKRTTWILVALFLLSLLTLGVWYGRQVRQQRLDHALIAAVMKNDTSTAMALLEEGADANATEKPEGPVTLHSLLNEFWNRLKGNQPKETSPATPALLLANKYAPALDEPFFIPENPKVTAALLEHGADPYKTDNFGCTVLHGAAAMGYAATVKVLLQHHVHPDCKDTQGQTSLMHAEEECARLLLENGTDVNARDKDGWTPLMVNSNLAVCQSLLDHHADINACAYDGRTALMIAAMDNSYTVRMRFLLQHGARVSLKNKEGLNALELAKKNGERYKIPLLEAALKKERAEQHTAGTGRKSIPSKDRILREVKHL